MGRARKIDDIYEQVAKGTKWGPVCRVVLERHHEGQPYSAELAAKFGITSRIYDEVLDQCKVAFHDAAGMSFEDFKAGKRQSKHKVRVSNTDYNALARRTNCDDLPVLKAMMNYARENLSHEELHAVCTLSLAKADKKSTVGNVCRKFECQEITLLNGYYRRGRQKLKAWSKEQDLDPNPYLRTRKLPRTRIPLANFDIPEPDFSDPKTLKLYKMSETLFDTQHHAMLCHELFAPREYVRNRAEIAKKLGLSIHYKAAMLPKAIKILRQAAEMEGGEDLSLAEHVEVLKQDLRYANDTSTKAKDAADFIDESKINLDLPGMREILDAIYSIKPDTVMKASAAPIFIMTCLYDAPHKMTSVEIQEELNYKPGVISTAGQIKSRVKKHLIENGMPELADHPVLRMSVITNDRDLVARDIIRSDEFNEIYDALDDEQKRIADFARTCFNPAQYYCYFRAFLSEQTPRYADLSEEVGFKYPIDSHRSAHSAKTIMDEYVEHFDNAKVEDKPDSKPF